MRYAAETDQVFGRGGGHIGKKGERPGWSHGEVIHEAGGANFVERGEVEVGF